MPAPEPRATRRVAVMQPYFFPYAGYFRLFAAVDEFVVYDCVQFPRRGRVHRTEVGDGQWLTLPLARQPREVPIRDLRFADDARNLLDARLAAIPAWRDGEGPLSTALRERLQSPLEDVVGFLEGLLVFTAAQLGFTPAVRRSSSLDVDPALRGQARVLAIADAVGATAYLNAPGGRALYDADSFAARGMSLEFLSPYTGPWVHLLPALLQASPAQLRADVLAQLRIEPASPESRP